MHCGWNLHNGTRKNILDSWAENASECNEWVNLLRKSVTSAKRLSSQVSTKKRLQVFSMFAYNCGIRM
jgi:hypothetical protein